MTFAPLPKRTKLRITPDFIKIEVTKSVGENVFLQHPVNVQAQTSFNLSEPSPCCTTDKSTTVVSAQFLRI